MAVLKVGGHAYDDQLSSNQSLEPTAGPALDDVYFFLALLLAAHRAFISCESLFLPAAVIPPFPFTVLAAAVPPFLFAHRALIAAAIFARA